MACNSHYCGPQGGAIWNNACGPQGTTIAPRPRTICKISIAAGIANISSAAMNEIFDAINSERSIRSFENISTQLSEWISTNDFMRIKNAIDECRKRDGQSNFSYSGGEYNNFIATFETQELRNFINILQAFCICQCNYCTCNCDYCTCNCNYCPCQCNYCTCNCNYQCTCNCDYRCRDY